MQSQECEVSPARVTIAGFCPEQAQGPGRGARQTGGGAFEPARVAPPVECRLQRTPNQECNAGTNGGSPLRVPGLGSPGFVTWPPSTGPWLGQSFDLARGKTSPPCPTRLRSEERRDADKVMQESLLEGPQRESAPDVLTGTGP